MIFIVVDLTSEFHGAELKFAGVLPPTPANFEPCIYRKRALISIDRLRRGRFFISFSCFIIFPTGGRDTGRTEGKHRVQRTHAVESATPATAEDSRPISHGSQRLPCKCGMPLKCTVKYLVSAHPPYAPFWPQSRGGHLQGTTPCTEAKIWALQETHTHTQSF